jgi:purine-nucleoside phosphorylase
MGPRFPATSNAYSEELRLATQKAAKELDMNFVKPQGTYCFVSGKKHNCRMLSLFYFMKRKNWDLLISSLLKCKGPMYESKAECRFLKMLGGDTVGMSTVPEAVTAHHCNMQGTIVLHDGRRTLSLSLFYSFFY